MTTPCSGRIAISDISTELGLVSTAYRTLGQPDGRVLAEVPSGRILLSDYYCKSGFMYATGGAVHQFTDGSGVTWRVHVFNSSGVLTVLRRGNLGGYVQRLVVGGGGGGGLYNNTVGSGGGGGAGDHLGGQGTANVYDRAFINVGSNPVTVGAGGALNANGGASSFAGITAIGGGRGGFYASTNGAAGASGGGAGQPGGGGILFGGAATGVNGFPGGNCDLPSGYNNGGGGGGGGSSGPGGNAFGSPTPIHGGNGGPGRFSAITGVSIIRAAGGGGAGTNASNTGLTPNAAGNPGDGGSGIGGRGARYGSGGATNPVANSGSGGGGSNGIYFLGTAGAAGVVVVRYPISDFTPP